MSVLHEATSAPPLSSAREAEPRVRAPRHGVAFVDERHEPAMLRELIESGHVVARLPRASSGASALDLPVAGQLRDAVEGSLEMALALRGALPSNVALGSSALELAKDQLFRVRALGMKGLALVIPELRRLAGDDGALSADDSEVLRTWRELADEEPVVLLLEEADRAVALHVPTTLGRWLDAGATAHSPRSLRWPDDERSVAPNDDRASDLGLAPGEVLVDAAAEARDVSYVAEDDESDALETHARPSRRAFVEADELFDAPTTLEEDDLDEEAIDAAALEETLGALPAYAPEADRPTMRDGLRDGAARLAAEHDHELSVMRHDPLAGLHEAVADDVHDPFGDLFRTALGAPMTSSEVEAHDPSSAATPSPEALEVMPARKTRKAPPKGPRMRTTTHRSAMSRLLDEEDDVSAPLYEPDLLAAAPRQETLPVERAEEPREAARRFDTASLRTHALTLDAARGSRPVKQIEQLYLEHYVPLLEAVSAGYADREGERAVNAWRASFEKSYVESFASIRVTGKRPKMVLDAPEDAIRVGRQCGARSVQLVLVDAMRAGLGLRVARRLEASMSDIGAEVERSLLWSALPSVTSVQMQLLSQGPRALREIEAPSERDLTAYRDGTACIPRRERIGQRDLLKLDVVEARLREPGLPYEGRMEDLADEVADAIVKVAEGLPPRTLLYVFGDHGFFLKPGGAGRTARAEQGAARPEEVLVPAYAWLIGATP
ncbi:MAG: hypothetical protein FJ095_05925 [Deltaproteobacteria bacterium]|nr:hypothetical protein [Deltaproteobacteria bacterium]